MPFFKVNLFFRGRNAGWSETYYSSMASAEQLRNRLDQQLIPDRVAFLAAPYECHAVRITNEDLLRDSILYAPSRAFPQFPSAWTGDLPHTAFHLRLQAGPGHWRQLMLRGNPDVAYNPEPKAAEVQQQNWEQLMLNFAQNLIANWMLKVKRSLPAIPRYNVKDLARTDAITATVQLFQNPNYEAGQLVKLYKVPGVLRQFGPVRILNVINATTFQVALRLPDGYAYAGNADAQRVIYDYEAVSSYERRGWTHRISGRPFGQQRGRRPVVSS